MTHYFIMKNTFKPCLPIVSINVTFMYHDLILSLCIADLISTPIKLRNDFTH